MLMCVDLLKSFQAKQLDRYKNLLRRLTAKATKEVFSVNAGYYTSNMSELVESHRD